MLLTFWGRTGVHLCDSNRWWTEWTEERVIINTLKHDTVCVCCTSVFVCELTWGGKVQFWCDPSGAHLNNKGWDKHYLCYADMYMNHADTTIWELCCVLEERKIYLHVETGCRAMKPDLYEERPNHRPIIQCVYENDYLWIMILCSWQDPVRQRLISYGGLYSESLGLWWMNAIKERKYSQDANYIIP